MFDQIEIPPGTLLGVIDLTIYEVEEKIVGFKHLISPGKLPSLLLRKNNESLPEPRNHGW